MRDSGVELAVVGRVYYGTLALGGALGTAAVYWLGGHAVIDGSIKRGRPDELLAAGGLYQELYETQYARTSPVPARPTAAG